MTHALKENRENTFLNNDSFILSVKIKRAYFIKFEISHFIVFYSIIKSFRIILSVS